MSPVPRNSCHPWFSADVPGAWFEGLANSRGCPAAYLPEILDVFSPGTAPRALTIATTRGPLDSTVSVTGDVVIDTSPRLRATLREAIRRRLGPVLVVDMAEVSYLDTSGVATLLEASRLARAHGVRLRVIGLAGEPEMLARVLEMDRILLALGSEMEFR